MYFFIQGTRTSPSAIINDGYMKITGNSTPLEKNNTFFGKISEQLDLYAQLPANKTFVEIELNHVNAVSKRNIIELLKSLENINKLGFRVMINWRFENENDDVRELGEIFDSMFNLSFNFIEV